MFLQCTCLHVLIHWGITPSYNYLCVGVSECDHHWYILKCSVALYNYLFCACVYVFVSIVIKHFQCTCVVSLYSLCQNIITCSVWWLCLCIISLFIFFKYVLICLLAVFVSLYTCIDNEISTIILLYQSRPVYSECHNCGHAWLQELIECVMCVQLQLTNQ